MITRNHETIRSHLKCANVSVMRFQSQLGRQNNGHEESGSTLFLTGISHIPH